jgi:hypothetical protein
MSACTHMDARRHGVCDVTRGVNGPAASFRPDRGYNAAIMPRGAGTFSEKSAFFAENDRLLYPSGVGRSAPSLLTVPVLGLHVVEDTVGSERFDRFDDIEAAMEAEPLSGMAMPLDVEAVGADPAEASEGRVELLAEIFREAGAVAVDEAILGAMPFAEDIDGIVELRRPD